MEALLAQEGLKAPLRVCCRNRSTTTSPPRMTSDSVALLVVPVDSV
ncbi:MAG TPA: hypothetical protein VLT84_00160 [Acidobacteriota bacterium]|nr:hypothetical protein [Acidobacteriota bacterium]